MISALLPADCAGTVGAMARRAPVLASPRASWAVPRVPAVRRAERSASQPTWYPSSSRPVPRPARAAARSEKTGRRAGRQSGENAAYEHLIWSRIPNAQSQIYVPSTQAVIGGNLNRQPAYFGESADKSSARFRQILAKLSSLTYRRRAASAARSPR
jgi:hypothetical protein